MKNLVLFCQILIITFFVSLTSCTTYTEASDEISVTVVVADIEEILDKLDDNEAKNQARFNELNAKLMLIAGDISAMKVSQATIASTLASNSILLQQYQNYFMQLISLGTLTEANVKIILSILGQVQTQLLQIASTQASHTEILNSLKKQILDNYLVMLSIANDLKDVKTWTLDNRDKLNQLIILFEGLENMTNIILDRLIVQGNLTFEKLNALSLQISLLQGSLDAWGSIIISRLDQLGLTLQQQGIILADILAKVNNLPVCISQIINKLNALQLSVNDIKATQVGILEHLISLKMSQTHMFEILNALSLKLHVLQGSVDSWGDLIISRLDKLELTMQQQGVILANILANTKNLMAFNAQIIAKLDALQLSVNEIKIIQMAIINQLYEIKATLVNVQAVVNSICTQVFLLREGQLDILIAIDQKLCDQSTNVSITNCYSYVFNEYITNTTNISQIYNACSNGLAGCSNGVVPPRDVCMVMNVISPHVTGHNNNVNYNFGNLYNTGYGNNNSISNNFGCNP